MLRALARLSGTTLFALFVGVVVVIVVIFLLASGGVEIGSSGDDSEALAGSEQVDEGTPSGQSEDSEGSPTLAVAPRQDEAFPFGDLLLNVTDIRLSTLVSEGDDEVEAIERFATVQLTVRNTGGAPRSLVGQLELVDDQDRVYSPDAAATAAVAVRDGNRDDALVVALQPDLELELVVVFQVPEEAENFRLRVWGGYVDVVLER